MPTAVSDLDPISASTKAATWYRRIGPGRLLTAVGLGTLLCAVTLSFVRILSLEKGELEHESPVVTLTEAAARTESTARTAHLSGVDLQALDRVVFELCSDDALLPETWEGTIEVAVLRQQPAELMLRVPFDADHLRHVERSERGACLLLGSGQLEHGGRYNVTAVFPEGTKGVPVSVAQIPLRIRTLARRELSLWDEGLLWLTAYGALILLLGLWAHRSRPSEVLPTLPSRGRSAAEVLLAGCCVVAVAQAPLWGATLGFVKGLLLAVTQAGLALGIARGNAPALALRRPPHLRMSLALALVAGFILARSAGFWQRMVPSTGTAPIETFVSWPSGLIAFAVLGAVLPLAEELFFRGLMYRWLLSFGQTAAFLLSLLAFIALHVQQTFGNWGSLLSIATTGLVLTSLRALTGSTLVPALTHVVYNLTLSLSSI